MFLRILLSLALLIGGSCKRQPKSLFNVRSDTGSGELEAYGQGPSSNDVSAEASGGAPVEIDMGLLNQLDADGGYAIKLIDTPRNGAADVNPSRPQLVSYIPKQGFEGEEFIRYQIEGPNYRSLPSTIAVIVTGAPSSIVPVVIAMNTAAVTLDLVALAKLTGTPSRFTLTLPPRHGRIVRFDEASGSLAYEPSADYVGPDTLVVRVEGQQLNTQEITLDLKIENLTGAIVGPPVPVVDTVNQSVKVWANESFVGTLGQIFGVPNFVNLRVVTIPAHGILNDFQPSSGQLTYTPQTGFVGEDVGVFEHDAGRLTLAFTVTSKNSGFLSEPPTLFKLTGSSFRRLPITLHSFESNHVDFKRSEADKVVTGMVSTTLSQEGKPRFVGRAGLGGVTSAGSFYQWFSGSLPATEALQGSLSFEQKDGKFTSQIGSLGALFGVTTPYTWEVSAQVVYKGGETLLIQSSDDLWVYLNRQLVIDLGGSHGTQRGFLSLNEVATRLGIFKELPYRIAIFGAQRSVESPVMIRTDLAFVSSNLFVYSTVVDSTFNKDRLFILKKAPQGMKIDSKTGRVTWAVVAKNVGKHEVAIAVKNAVGVEETQSFTLEVTH